MAVGLGYFEEAGATGAAVPVAAEAGYSIELEGVYAGGVEQQNILAEVGADHTADNEVTGPVILAQLNDLLNYALEGRWGLCHAGRAHQLGGQLSEAGFSEFVDAFGILRASQ